MLRFCILASGQGTNADAILRVVDDHRHLLECVGIVTDQPEAGVIDVAQTWGLPGVVLDLSEGKGRSVLDRALLKAISSWEPDLIVMAGFMRIVGTTFLDRWPGRVINIHPSLLPSFRGLHTHQRAIDAGVAVHGCTVHQVDRELDSGAILGQAIVPVLPTDSAAILAKRVQAMEHRIYPEILVQIADGRIEVEAQQVRFSESAQRVWSTGNQEVVR